MVGITRDMGMKVRNDILLPRMVKLLDTLYPLEMTLTAR